MAWWEGEGRRKGENEKRKQKKMKEGKRYIEKRLLRNGKTMSVESKREEEESS